MSVHTNMVYVCYYNYISLSFFYQYDLNGDGVLEFVLTTTDAEILFVQTDNTLLHGETIKVHVYLAKCSTL